MGDDGHGTAFGKLLDEPGDPRHVYEVEARRRLVQNDDLLAAQKGASQRQALLLASRQVLRMLGPLVP